jgi:two-component system, OmpR family, manganese sensing response regulator
MNFGAKRILCVEDDEDTCTLLKIILADLQVVTANTLAEALTLARNECFDLYLLDFFLPDGTGIDLCQLMRQFDQKTPLLFCSADAYPTSQEKALQAGAQVYLIKPVEPSILREVVLRLLRAPDSAGVPQTS